MAAISFTARVLEDGHIPPPREAGLASGDVVAVTLTVVKPSDDESPHARNLFEDFFGTMNSGRSDLAERHDEILAQDVLDERE